MKFQSSVGLNTEITAVLSFSAIGGLYILPNNIQVHDSGWTGIRQAKDKCLNIHYAFYWDVETKSKNRFDNCIVQLLNNLLITFFFKKLSLGHVFLNKTNYVFSIWVMNFSRHRLLTFFSNHSILLVVSNSPY